MINPILSVTKGALTVGSQNNVRSKEKLGAGVSVGWLIVYLLRRSVWPCGATPSWLRHWPGPVRGGLLSTTGPRHRVKDFTDANSLVPSAPSGVPSRGW